ncbi:MAG: diguanylate cyclase [Lachnospiraceae bacterium]|nr:diguanylate cyclase [Lachnospiraceae bacterium]
MKNKKKGLYFSFLLMTIIPIIVYTAIMIAFTAGHIEDMTHNEIKVEMEQIVYAIEEIYDTKYEGNFSVDEDKEVIFKGEHNISLDYSIVDDIKTKFGVDISIIYGKKRYITTLRDSVGRRHIGTEIPSRISYEIYKNKETKFYDNILIRDSDYVAVYSPIMDDGEVVGMIAVMKSASQVDTAVFKAILPIILLATCMMVITGAFSVGYARHIVENIRRIQHFLARIASGDLTCRQLDSDLKRNNELGEMARNAEKMQQSIRTLVEIDELTGVLNRKAGTKRIRKVFEKLRESDGVVSVVLGDIDFFKKVNDTYGHETGDVVLRSVAQTISDGIEGKGVLIRWGGEEFLMIFEGINKAETMEIMEKVREDIKSKTFSSDGVKFNVTMTFGVKQADMNMNYSEAIARADELLYKGKQGGRDRVV